MKSERYDYACSKCEGAVTKAPTGQSENAKGKGGGHGLHGWSCENCGAGVKVSRTLK